MDLPGLHSATTAARVRFAISEHVTNVLALTTKNEYTSSAFVFVHDNTVMKVVVFLVFDFWIVL